MKKGAEVLNESINTTTKKLLLRLRLPPQTTPADSTTASPSFPNESHIWSSSIYPSSTSAGRELNDPSSVSPSLSASSTDTTKLSKYIEMCKDKANKHGFNLQSEIQQVLANKSIILLKKGQTCSVRT